MDFFYALANEPDDFFSQEISLVELVQQNPHDAAAQEWFEILRWSSELPPSRLHPRKKGALRNHFSVGTSVASEVGNKGASD